MANNFQSAPHVMPNNYQNTPINTTNPAWQQPFPQNSPQYFLPQPAGNVYTLGSSSEIGNVPISGNLSAGICFNEGVLYIKTLQNNGPALLAYKLVPLENAQQQSAQNTQEQSYDTVNSRLDKIEQILAEKLDGGKKWQL